MGTGCGAECIAVAVVSYLGNRSSEFFKLSGSGLILWPSAQAAMTSALPISISCIGQPSISSTIVAFGAEEDFSFFLPMGRPRCGQSKQAWSHFEGKLDGWQGSVNACGVREDIRILTVLWYAEVHADESCLSLMAA